MRFGSSSFRGVKSQGDQASSSTLNLNTRRRGELGESGVPPCGIRPGFWAPASVVERKSQGILAGGACIPWSENSRYWVGDWGSSLHLNSAGSDFAVGLLRMRPGMHHGL